MPSSCPSNDVLLALLADQLTEGEVAAVAEHLAVCTTCRRRLEELSGGTKRFPDKAFWRANPECRSSPRLRAVMAQLRSFSEASARSPLPNASETNVHFLSPSDQPGVMGRFGPYEIIEEIARGGMGVVLKAHDPVLDRIVAIKVLAPALATNQKARARFLREARAAAAVSHEHVVGIHAVDEANGLPYLVMQFISGTSLATRIHRTGPLRLEEILRIGIQVASGLAAAHAQGVIHRDIKPGNILLENSVERVKITDFGLALVAADASTSQIGLLAGTPEFMAPEQARGEPVDHRADLFSLGCVLYCMATGESPFEGPSLISVIHRLCDEEARPLKQVHPELPDWFGQLVSQLLAKDPAQRPQSAQEVAQLLEHHLARLQRASPSSAFTVEPEPGSSGTGVCGSQSGKRTTRRWFAVFALGAGGLTVLGLFVAFLLTRPPQALVTQAFKVLGKNDQATGHYSSLSEAVRLAISGATIEVRINGESKVQPLALGNKALTIRAAPGFHPVLVNRQLTDSAFTTEALLVLEGLELRVEDRESSRPSRFNRTREIAPLISSRSAPIFLANCCFRVPLGNLSGAALFLTNCPEAELRNCEIYTRGGRGVAWVWAALPPLSNTTLPRTEPTLSMENCVLFSDTMLELNPQVPVRATIRLLHNTTVARVVLVLPALDSQGGLSIFAGTNLFGSRVFFQRTAPQGMAELKETLHWEESHNLFSVADSFAERDISKIESNIGDLTAWNRYWNQTNTGSVNFRLGLGVPLRRTSLGKLRAQLFQLNADDWKGIETAGGHRTVAYGAASELVGPGRAYVSWRRSPEYRQWVERVRQAAPRTGSHPAVPDQE